MLGVSSIPWSPLARGFLTRPANSQVKTKRTETDPYAAYPFPAESGANVTIGRCVHLFLCLSCCCSYIVVDLTECSLKYVYSVEEIAKKKGVSMAQIAVAWILSKDRQFTPLLF